MVVCATQVVTRKQKHASSFYPEGMNRASRTQWFSSDYRSALLKGLFTYILTYVSKYLLALVLHNHMPIAQGILYNFTYVTNYLAQGY